MYQAVRDLLAASEFSVVESFEIPGREARYAEIPPFLSSSPVGSYLTQKYPAGLWSHQAQAMEAIGRGENVVVSTATASGKSLIFQAATIHKLLTNLSSKALVFYPLRALVADQLTSWREFARSIGLEEKVIGQIDGSVPVRERDDILRDARVVVMTPDVCQAWMMSRLSTPVVKEFVGSLSTIIVDEAHSLEAVFGSNFAFFIRRLEAARNYIVDGKATQPLQYIGATATIAKPDEHMKLLTGHEFTVIDNDADGSPQHNRILAHVACPEGEELEIAKNIQDYVLGTDSDKAFITFVDSRKAVEILALSAQADDDFANNPAVAPYRSGYIDTDRRRIERLLREGSLRGVVSTAALELGVDLPHLSVGFNVGVPWSRKSYRQRIGRVGRNGQGAFVVIGAPDAFRKFGTSFREYHDLPVEPSYLYLDNRFMQFAHARCLVDERDALAAPASLPTPGQWPNGFEGAYKAARPGGSRPIEFDAIARLAGDAPHRGYPLRNVGEFNYDIKVHENAPSIGDISEVYALRECYPGATYLHNMTTYEVTARRSGRPPFIAPFIQVRHVPFRGLTKPQLTTWINADVTNSFLKGPRGFFAECQMQVTEQVKGYFDSGGTFHSYADLRQSNPNMISRSRMVRTSGVILYMDNEWFRNERIRRMVADKIREIFVHEHSINPQDIGSAVTHISIHGLDEAAPRSGCIAIYDETYGSLRLTEQLYANFDHIIQRLANAIAEEFSPVVAEIHDGFSSFASYSPLEKETDNQAQTGYVHALKPGSQALFGEPGGSAMQEVEILQLTILPDGRLMYQVQANTRPGQPPMRRWIPFESTVSSPDSDAYEIGLWNMEAQQFEDDPDEESSN